MKFSLYEKILLDEECSIPLMFFFFVIFIYWLNKTEEGNSEFKVRMLVGAIYKT